jgi:hypothetical protein
MDGLPEIAAQGLANFEAAAAYPQRPMVPKGGLAIPNKLPSDAYVAALRSPRRTR